MLHQRPARLRGRLASLLLSALLFAPNSFAAGPETGDRLPDTLGRMPSGERITLNMLLDEKETPLVITFWATWCAPCMKELPVLESLQDVAGDRLRVVAVNWKEDRRVFNEFVRQFPDLNIELLHDRNGRAAKQYKLRAIPYLMLVNGDGTLRKAYIGYNEEKLPEIIEAINAMIASD